jgi:hypothetical protein
MLDTPSVVAPRRLASGTLMMARGGGKSIALLFSKIRWWIWAGLYGLFTKRKKD